MNKTDDFTCIYVGQEINIYILDLQLATVVLRKQNKKESRVSLTMFSIHLYKADLPPSLNCDMILSCSQSLAGLGNI